MPLLPGSRLGPYEILSPLGAGGMGEVFRARDGRLGREVAIKVLPAELSSDAGRLKRFEKEARSASSLNHPNIVTVHDIGSEGSVSYIAMELVEGKTLRELLLTGPLPIKKLLQIAPQVADGLAKAHEAGIVHRDLKPENVMVTGDGRVKILDFGLAKVTQPDSDAAESQSPTFTRGTEPGVVMGTVGYMSPEQASGHAVDYRSDQFSFGSVLYEMATGKRAFEGKTKPEILAAIIREEPEPIASLAPETPAPLRWIVERCLAKEPRERYASTEDLARDLANLRGRISETSGSGEALAIQPSRARGAAGRETREKLAWGAAGALLIAAALSTAAYLRGRQVPGATLRASILPPEKTTFSMTGEDIDGDPAPVAVSPDGKRLVFGVVDGDQTRLCVRPLDSFAARSLQGTEGASYPFWSPDGGRIGFFTGYPRGQLKAISAAGGPLETIVDAPNARGGSWGRHGTFLFAPENAGAIFQVSEKGGKATPVTFPPAPGTTITHRFPSFLPDGRHFLYLAKRMLASETIRDSDLGVFVGSTTSKETRRLLPDISSAVYAPPGYVLFVREGTLMALPFDAAALDATGPPIPIVQNVEFSTLRSNGVFSASAAEVLAFRVGVGISLSRLVWLDRSGKPAGTAEMPPSIIDQLRLSPDGKRASIVLQEPRTGNFDLWAFDLLRNTRTRLTRGNTATVEAIGGVFSPDGSRVVFSSRGKEGSEDLSVMNSSGEGALQTVVSSPEGKTATDWSRDGRFILFERVGTRKRAEIWVYSLIEGKASPFLQTESGTRSGVFSPDGRWVAYVSDESGQPEIFVRPFPGPGVRQQISRGGRGPIRWSQDGREIVYGTGGKLMAVEVKMKDAFEAGEPRVILQLPPGTEAWDVTPDHQRILIAARAAEEKPSPPICLVTNWAAELRN